MKIAMLFYHSVFDDEVHRALDAVGCASFVEVPHAWARDGSDRRFGTHIYPGTDAVTVAFVDDACTARLTDWVKAFRAQRGKEHTHVALVGVDEFI